MFFVDLEGASDLGHHEHGATWETLMGKDAGERQIQVGLAGFLRLAHRDHASPPRGFLVGCASEFLADALRDFDEGAESAPASRDASCSEPIVGVV